MLPKLRTPLIVLGGAILLAAAAFLAVGQLSPNRSGLSGPFLPGVATDPARKKQDLTLNVIPATEMPLTNPDVVGRLDSRTDNSLMVRPDSKGAPAPLVEVVVTGQTQLYWNATGDPPVLGVRTPPPSGATVQMVLVPYTLQAIAAGDNIIAWGERRGSRLVAQVVMVEKQN